MLEIQLNSWNQEKNNLKKNIVIISGSYPTNGILTLTSYFSHSLLSNKDFKKKYNLKILIFNENLYLKTKKTIFNIILFLKNNILNQNNRIHKFAYTAKQFITDNKKIEKYIHLYSKESDFKKHKPNIIFPILIPSNPRSYLSIGYIYDFQHEDLPNLFSKSEKEMRDRLFLKTIRYNDYIFVNSNFVRQKVLKKYEVSKNKIIRIPFLPYIQHDIEHNVINRLKIKYEVNKKYFIICNHFWKHKNHEIAFKAFSKYLKQYPDYQLVCTGDINDTRDVSYFKKLRKKYKNYIETKKILILGVLPRKEQLSLLKGAIAVIQPTLYEGGPGGFSAYEAIAFKKKLILSDIKVNKEIYHKDVFFFKNNSSTELMKIMIYLKKKDINYKNKKKIIKDSQKNKKLLGLFLYKLINKIN